MVTEKKKRLGITAGLVLVVAALLCFYRFELLFSFQRFRLRQLDCNSQLSSPPKKVLSLNACDKFWAHRVNSYERFELLSPYFAGLETDLVFDTLLKKCRVYHPPEPAADLFADRYFQSIRLSGKKLWLDIKDIHAAAFSDAIVFFEHSDSLYGLKANVIIESSQIDFVNRLAKLGFTVSYMALPDSFAVSAVKLVPEVAFVSQEDIYLDKLKTNFPGKKIITWAISFRNYLNLSHFRDLLADSSVSVVLINVKSRYYK